MSTLASPGIGKLLLPTVAVAAVAAITVFAWIALAPPGPGVGIVEVNGRTEATDIDGATKLAGRVRARHQEQAPEGGFG